MTQVPASSHGSIFNGGTITQPLVIATADGNVVPLTVRASWNAQNTDFLAVVNADNDRAMVEVDSTGKLSVLDHATSAQAAVLGTTSNQLATLSASGVLGFYGTPSVAQPTGVAVTAAGIHAALVSLGLITA